MPPIAGRIAWVRQLTSRINESMEIFRQYDIVLSSEKNRKIVASFNKTLLSLVSYERNCQKQFQDDAMLPKKDMANNLIRMDSGVDTRYVVNFAQNVMGIFQEANVFKRFGFELLKGFDQLLAREQALKYSRAELHNLLIRYHQVNAQIRETFPELFSDGRAQLAKIIEPGCQTLTWSSLSIDKYLGQFREKVSLIEEALNKVRDIRVFSINRSLQKITDTRLIPQFKEPITDSQELLDRVRIDAAEAAKRIHARVQGLQASVCEILRIISTVSAIGSKSEGSDQECIFRLMEEKHIMVVVTRPVYDLFKRYEDMTNRAIFKCFRSSVRDLVDILKSSSPSTPTLFVAELKPTVPDLTISPNIAGLQGTLSEVVRTMVRAARGIATWSATTFESVLEQNKTGANAQEKEREVDEDSENQDLVPTESQDIRPMNYFTILTRDNTMIALLISMTNKMAEFEPRIAEYIGWFSQYKNLWESDGDSAFAEFEARKPQIREIKEQMDKFLLLETKIEKIEEKSRVGPVLLSCEGVKHALIAEAKKWKQKYGDLINKIGRTDMLKLSEFMEKMKNSLSRNIGALEDLRAAMESLKKVRSMAAKIDIKMAPIDESYMMLSKYNIVVPQRSSSNTKA